MTVEVRLPRGLREMYGVPLPAAGKGTTVGEVIESLDAAYPGLGHRLVDGGALRRHIIVFVGERQGTVDSPVPAGAGVTVVTAVAGGSPPSPSLKAARRPSSSP